MSIARHIAIMLKTTDWVVRSYVQDLTDEQLLIRPAPGVNHIAWQLGHLIAAEHKLVEMVCPGTMPALPSGFPERFTNETAKLDDPKAFLPLSDYLNEMEIQRGGTMEVLEKLSDEALMAPSPEALQVWAPTVGAVFDGQATHWLMHAGQWVVVRRMLGKPAIF